MSDISDNAEERECRTKVKRFIRRIVTAFDSIEEVVQKDEFREKIHKRMSEEEKKLLSDSKEWLLFINEVKTDLLFNTVNVFFETFDFKKYLDTEILKQLQEKIMFLYIEILDVQNKSDGKNIFQKEITNIMEQMLKDEFSKKTDNHKRLRL